MIDAWKYVKNSQSNKIKDSKKCTTKNLVDIREFHFMVYRGTPMYLPQM